MTILEIVNANLEYGDIVKLRTWEWLSRKCFHEQDGDKENGNLVCPNGYRLLQSEKDLYGKSYKVKSVKTSEFSGVTVNCMGKSEISPFEIETIVKGEKQTRTKRRDVITVEETSYYPEDWYPEKDITEVLNMEEKKCNHQKK